MKTSKLLLALFAAAGLCVAGAGNAAQTMSKDAHDTAYKNAESQYKMDKAPATRCPATPRTSAWKRPRARKRSPRPRPTPRTRTRPRPARAARIAHADAAYDVAKEKCDDLSGNPKDVCVKEAKAAHVKAKADAKVDRVAADTRNTATEKTADARRDAAEDKRDADYKVAIEKCDSLAGPSKDACVAEREGEVRQELRLPRRSGAVGSPPDRSSSGRANPGSFL